MNGKSTLAYSRLGNILAEQHRTVAGFIEKLKAKGISLDKKTLYRLAGPEPIQTINTRILGAVCEELKVGIDEILTWQQPKPILQRIDEKTQRRLALLMDKNNEGALTQGEARELAELGAHAERLSLENARMLARIARGKKRPPAPAAAKRAVLSRTAKSRRSSPRKVVS